MFPMIPFVDKRTFTRYSERPELSRVESGDILSVFGISKDIRLVSIAGAGGKTTLSHQILLAAVRSGRRCLQLPTAHISMSQACQPVVTGDVNTVILELSDLLRRSCADKKGITVSACAALAGINDKYTGFTPEEADEIIRVLKPDLTVTEADGARNLDFKAPADHEKLIPSGSDLTIVCASARAFGRAYDHKRVHRADEVKKFLEEEDNNLITPGLLGRIASSEAGYGYVKNARLAVYVTGLDKQATGSAVSGSEICSGQSDREDASAFVNAAEKAVKPLIIGDMARDIIMASKRGNRKTIDMVVW